MSSMLFDLEYLQKLTYDRSKYWASFLDDVSKRETLEEIELEEFEDIYNNSCDESDDDLLSMEDGECDNTSLNSDVLRNVTNTTRLSLFFDNKTLALPDSSINDEKNQLIDIYNLTLPIINEHNRQLKQTGFDKILSTFDKKKIEDKVGSWLNRHNSLFGGDNTLKGAAAEINLVNEPDSPAHVPRVTDRPRRFKRHAGIESLNDSDDSLQSGETARYIKSSRAGTIKNVGSTSHTMIKTYRMVNSTREQLHERYAYEREDNDHHIETIQGRKNLIYDQKCQYNRYGSTHLLSSRKNELHSLKLQKQRPKVLRKRVYSNICSTTDLSSDSDSCYNYNRRNFKSCCRHHCSDAQYNNYPALTATTTATKMFKTKKWDIKMRSARRNRMCYYSRSQDKSLMSPTSSSSSSVCERRRSVKTGLKFYSVSRPCKRESECHCCKKDKLFKEYKHISDSSTEEWCYAHKKPLRTPVTSTKTYESMRSAVQKLPAAIQDEDTDYKTKRNLKEITSKKPPKDVQLNKDEKIRKLKSKTSTTKNSSSDENVEKETTFDCDLQKAILASKRSYEKEIKRQGCKEVPQKTRKIKNPPKQSSTKTSQEFLNPEEIVRKRPATENKNIAKLTKLIDDDDDNDEDVYRTNSYTIEIPTTKNTNSITNTKDESCFADIPTQRICNSTALSANSEAYDRQFCGQLVTVKREEKKSKDDFKEKVSKIKKLTKKKHTLNAISDGERQHQKVAASTTVTSTTIRSPDINSTLSTTLTEIKSTELIYEINSDDNSDCTLVTSTTNLELPLSGTINKKFDDTKKQSSTSTSKSISKHQQTQMGIVIYTPEYRNMVPSYSFTSDGYFTVTKEHLSNVIGEKQAQKFLKYYIGRKRFSSNSTVYYRPPPAKALDGNNENSSSGSDDDLENLGLYGDLYESFDKTIKSHKNK